MTNQHPITPPPDLVQQWREESSTGELHFSPQYLATQAARWGADMELDACCKLVPGSTNYLRTARRPKPPSLKEQALRILVENGTTLDGRIELEPEDIPIIRQALEALPND